MLLELGAGYLVVETLQRRKDTNARRNTLGGGFLLGVSVAVIAIVGLIPSGGGNRADEQRADEQRAETQAVTERPNFVFVMTDDLDERSMQDLPGIRSVMGANGTTFNNAYVTYSFCCPSRATILRGQYPHNHNIVGNSLDTGGGEKKFRQLGRDQSTVATWLNDAGYRTKLIGKYMNSYNDLYVPPGWDEWFALKQQGGEFYDAVNEDGQWTTLGGRHSADVFADEASDFIRRSSASPDPFFVMVDTIAPHAPPEVAARYQDAFATTPLPKPPNFNEADVSDKPAWVRSRNRHSQAQIDETQQLYRQQLRSMLSVEDLLRQTIATLQETGELENTYILFTSDNGYHLGNHRLWQGKRAPYEEDIGVPLMVRGPGVPAGIVRNQLVLNNDFAPTIADLAGASTPSFVDGRSFAPLLSGSPPSSWRQAFLEEGWFIEDGSLLVPTHKGVHTQDHMFVEYDTGERELYDLTLDPYQLQSKPRASNVQLYSPLETRLYNLRDCSAAACRTAEWTTDATAPRVTATVPNAKAAGVAPSANLTATFSEDMKATSINGTTFKLFERGSTTQVGASVSYSASTDKATLDPNTSLRRGVAYDARITTGANDLVGNHLDQSSSLSGLQQKAWSFTVSN
jgi:N-acetylglucosamine-6-sulfatase